MRRPGPRKRSTLGVRLTTQGRAKNRKSAANFLTRRDSPQHARRKFIQFIIFRGHRKECAPGGHKRKGGFGYPASGCATFQPLRTSSGTNGRGPLVCIPAKGGRRQAP